MKAQVGLTLSPEHLAELNYYRDSGPQITYPGAWEYTEQAIILLFNARNGRAASESIPLQRQGESLSADYRLLNGGKAYFDEPLVLQPGTPALPLPPQGCQPRRNNKAVGCRGALSSCYCCWAVASGG